MGRYDISANPPPHPSASETGLLPPFPDFTLQLSESPVVSIASVRGRARGGGSELALACDLRFASLEKARFGQPEVGAGFLPGGGAIERLPRLVSRSRALEIIISSDDFDAKVAAEYGWINRAHPDAELDGFVDRLARRIAFFSPEAVSEAKLPICRKEIDPPEFFGDTLRSLLRAGTWPGAVERREHLRSRAIEAGADFEVNLGDHLGPE
ncbi:enoyl-CoA hydratase/isomerase family protein [Rhodococcus erythropolis]